MQKYADWPDKVQAAQRIGVSVKTLERMADRGEIEQRFRPRPGRSNIAVFNPRDVERKASERAAADSEPFVLPTSEDEPETSTAIATTTSKSQESFSQAFQSMMQAALPQARNAPPPESLEHRDVLNLREAQRLKGYSVAFMEQEHAAGRLQFYKMPGRRGRHVLRRDLDRIEAMHLPVWTGRVDTDESV